MRRAFLHAGGLDSTAALLLGGFENKHIDLLCIDYGQRAFKAELDAVKGQAVDINSNSSFSFSVSVKTHRVSPAQFVPYLSSNFLFTGNTQHSVELPNRNEVLISESASYFPRYDELWVGVEPTLPEVTPFADCTLDFFDEMRRKYMINIKTPLLNLDYFEYQRKLRELFLGKTTKTVMSKVMTCWNPKQLYSGEYMGCGKCAHCHKLQTLKDTLNV